MVDGPPPPEHWPQPLRDDAERLMRTLAKSWQDGMGALQFAYRDQGVQVDWDKPGAREWLLARLAARFFQGQGWPVWHRIQTEAEPVAGQKQGR